MRSTSSSGARYALSTPPARGGSSAASGILLSPATVARLEPNPAHGPALGRGVGVAALGAADGPIDDVQHVAGLRRRLLGGVERRRRPAETGNTARDDEPAPRSEEIAPPEDGDGDGFAWLGELEAHAQEIADELARVAIMGQSGSTGEYWRSGFYNGEHNGGFQLLDLINDDTPREDMREAFPKTFDAIQRSGAPFGPRLVAFGRMKPHTWLPRHSDKCNYLLTAHIPLPIPKTAFAPSARTAEALDIVAIRHALDSHSRKEQAKGRACPSPLTRAGLAGITVADEANAWVTSGRCGAARATHVRPGAAHGAAAAGLAVRRSHPTRGVSAQLSAQRVQRRRGGRDILFIVSGTPPDRP